ncbi:MAG: replicative DNA helicase [Planctomycetes bacterium]|nr:replicative DNA helicase [Planctomycetota bacterium]
MTARDSRRHSTAPSGVEGRNSEELFPPHDIAAERAVLASMMLSGDAAAKAVEDLRGDEFYSRQHGTLFRCFYRLYSDGKPLDANVVRDDLEKHGEIEDVGGMEFILELFDEVASGANIASYTAIVKERCLRRRILESATAAVRDVYNPVIPTADVLNTVEQQIYDLSFDPDRVAMRSLEGIIKDVLENVTRLYESPVYVTGLPTGFKDLDKLTGGLQPGEFTIVAGRPSMGKTTFALNLVQHMCVTEVIPAVFFSLEMTADQLGLNLLCCHCHVDGNRVRTGHLSAEDHGALITEGGPALYDAPLHIDDSPELTITEIRGRARRYIRQHSAKVVFIDYIQFVKGASGLDSREQQVADISRGLKGLAKDLGVPVVALSQLNRNPEGRVDKRPMLSDLRESGSIEQDADVVMLLHRHDYYDPDDHPGELEIIIAKNRNGPTGNVTLAYMRNQMRMEDITHGVLAE